MRLRAIVAAASAVAVAGLPPAASATFPGRNGVIAHDTGYSKGGYGSSQVLVAYPRRDVPRAFASCTFDGLGGCGTWIGSFSRSGRLVLSLDRYGASLQPAGSSLFLIGPGSTREEVALAKASYDAAWSPDGSMLLVTRPAGADSSGVFLVGADGRELGPVTSGGGAEPDWSVDGTIAYVHQGDIWLKRLGGEPRRLTWYGGSSPSWAPDGRRLAFARNGEIWAARADGSGRRRLTRSGLDRQPAWSPDGRWIAFLRDYEDFYSHGPWLKRIRADRRNARPRRGGGELNGAGDIAWQPLPRR